MPSRLTRFLLAALGLALACVALKPSLLTEASAAPVTAQTADVPKDDGHWLRFQNQATGLCAGFPGGRVRHQPYGVGDNRYVLHAGKDIATNARDFGCTGSNPLVLGPRGALSYVTFDPRPYSEVVWVEPRATKLALFDHHPCVLLDGGSIICAQSWDGRGSSQQQLADDMREHGPIARVLPEASCALTVAGDLVCGRVGTRGAVKIWSGVRQASVFAGGALGGCVVKLDGTVECIGENRFGERGTKARVDRETPTKVEGLRDIVEVSSSGSHACARDREGRVFCWGRAASREVGSRGYDDADKLPKCEIDRKATAVRQSEYEQLEKRCAGQEVIHDPRRDDPCRRWVHQFERSGGVQPVYKTDGICEVSDTPVRFNPRPTRVGEVSGAVAIAVRHGMSCALTRTSRLVCWGFGLDEPRVQQLPLSAESAAAAEALPVFDAKAPHLSVSAHSGVCFRDSSETVVRVPFSREGRMQAAIVDKEKAEDSICFPYMTCRLGADRKVSCQTPTGSPTAGDGIPVESDARVRLRTLFRNPCLLRDDGVLRCGRGFGSQDQMNRIANALSAAGPIQRPLAGAPCALFTDHTVRCLVKAITQPPVTVLSGVAAASADGLFLGSIPNLCAAMKDGTVQCLGGNEQGQRGTTEPTTPDAPNTVAGLTNIVEVAVSPTHACALDREGRVHCWGAASKGQTGRTAYDAARVGTLCPLDKEAMAAERRRMERESPECRERPPASNCTPVVYSSTKNCDAPSDGLVPRKLERPMQVPGIDRALAIDVSDGVSCALLAGGSVGCWGNRNSDVTFRHSGEGARTNP